MGRKFITPAAWIILIVASRAASFAADLTFTGDHVAVVRSPVSQIVSVDVFLRVQNGPALASQFRYEATDQYLASAQIIGGGDPINHPDAFADRPPQVTAIHRGVRASGQLSQPNINVPLRDGVGLFHIDVEIPADTTGVFALRPDSNLTWVAQANGLKYTTRAWGPIIVITEPPPPVVMEDTPHLRLFWSDPTAGRIYRSHVEGTEPKTVLPGAHGADSIALDVAHGHVYWAEGDPFTPELIRRSNLDGSNVQTIVSKEAGFVNIEQTAGGLAIDAIHGKLYYAEGWTSTIRRVDFDGTNEEVLMRDPTSAPVSLALDLPNGHIYSTHSHGSSSSVERSNLDGSNRVTLLSPVGFLGGLGIDPINGHLYWTDSYPNSSAIRRSKLDGSELTTLVDLGGFRPGGLELDLLDRKMYWTYWDNDYHQGIHRANLDGSQFETIFRAEMPFGFTRVGDIAVIAIPEPAYGGVILPLVLIVHTARWSCRRNRTRRR